MSYGKVKDGFWTSKKVRSFSDDAKLLALYLISGPHRNILGCMRVPNGYITEDLGWSSARLADAMEMLSERRFLCRDDDGWTLILGQLEHDPLKVPNHARAAIALANEVPTDSVIYQRLVPLLTENLKAIKMASEWHPKGVAIPEPLPEPEPEPVLERGAPPSAAPPAPPTPVVPKPPKADRGTRIASDWMLPDDWRAWTTTELLSRGVPLGAAVAWITQTAATFRDHWLQSSRPTAIKRDWQAAWRVWIRKEISDGKLPPADMPTSSASVAPEKRLRDSTLDEQELARRVRKPCGKLVTDAQVAEWRKLDVARAA